MDLEKYRGSEYAKILIDETYSLLNQVPSYLRFMEVCGTHTMAISRSGLRSILDGKVDLLSGPGCPVCVTADRDIDLMISLARIPNVTVTTFGDMMKVPGSQGSLSQAKANGGDVEVVYSPLDAVKLARQSDKEVVFLAVGFETTTPVIALALLEAERLSLKNFSIMVNHKLTPPAVRAIVDTDTVKVDGFLCPGHVSSILGSDGFAFLADEYSLPAVVAGFEPVDILLGVNMLLKQIIEGSPRMENTYRRVVRKEGNKVARELVTKYFVPASAEWRGLGTIPESGLSLREQYRGFDAMEKFELEVPSTPTVRQGCSCGAILRGLLKPTDCGLFGSECTPEVPVGPCMVSSEGACAAYYHFERRVRV